MDNVIKIKFGSGTDAVTQFYQSAVKYYNPKGELTDYQLHNRLTTAFKKGWTYILYSALLIRDKQMLEATGFKITDIGSTYKIEITAAARKTCGM